MIKYSIIMPVYNAEEKLDISINSIIKQTYTNWELILVDDGSTDNSLKKMEKYKKLDDRIFIYHQENSGPGSARNHGISKSTGDYISFVDSDDYIEKDYLSLINQKIKQEFCDLIFISMVNEKANGTIINVINTNKYSGYSQNEILSLEIMGIVPWGPCSKIVRKEIIQNSLFSDLEVGEEIIYSYEIIKKSKKISFIDKPLYHYIHNEEGQHTKGGIDPWYPVVKNIENYLKEKNEIFQFDNAINGLALKALVISIYRSSVDSKYKVAIKRIKKQIEKYKKEYDFRKINYKHLDRTTKIILFFINIKLYFLIFLASKFKKKLK